MIWSPEVSLLERARKLRIKDRITANGFDCYFWNRYKDKLVYHNQYSYLIVSQGSYEILGLIPLSYDSYNRSWRLKKDSQIKLAELLGINYSKEFRGDIFVLSNVTTEENLLIYRNGNRLIEVDCLTGLATEVDFSHYVDSSEEVRKALGWKSNGLTLFQKRARDAERGMFYGEFYYRFGSRPARKRILFESCYTLGMAKTACHRELGETPEFKIAFIYKLEKYENTRLLGHLYDDDCDSSGRIQGVFYKTDFEFSLLVVHPTDLEHEGIIDDETAFTLNHKYLAAFFTSTGSKVGIDTHRHEYYDDFEDACITKAKEILAREISLRFAGIYDAAKEKGKGKIYQIIAKVNEKYILKYSDWQSDEETREFNKDKYFDDVNIPQKIEMMENVTIRNLTIQKCVEKYEVAYKGPFPE